MNKNQLNRFADPCTVPSTQEFTPTKLVIMSESVPRRDTKSSQAGDEGLRGEVCNNVDVNCLYRQTHKNTDITFHYGWFPDATDLKM